MSIIIIKLTVIIFIIIVIIYSRINIKFNNSLEIILIKINFNSLYNSIKFFLKTNKCFFNKIKFFKIIAIKTFLTYKFRNNK